MMPWWAWLICSFCLFVFQLIVADAIKADQNIRILKLVRWLMVFAIVLALVEGITKFFAT
jgi:hypothetical protein